MTEEQITADVLIIGAGIGGLMAATVLERAGLSVTIVDKSHRTGGRLATRRIGAGFADHGAQFFTVRDPEFRLWVDRWIDAGLVYVWAHGFSDGQTDAPGDGYERYAVRGGVNALAQHITSSLTNVRLNVRIRTATCDSSGWILQDDDANIYDGRALLVTPPVPQSLEILDEGATVLSRGDYAALNEIHYDPCLAGLFRISGATTLPEPGAIQKPDAEITWIADNQMKGISPEECLVTVHASAKYSADNWTTNDADILEYLEAALRPYLANEAAIQERQLKRWRYSTPRKTYLQRCLVADNDPPLIFAGDAFGGPRVEGAVLSGLAAGEAMLKALSTRA